MKPKTNYFEEPEMTEKEFVDFCYMHGACNVNLDGEITPDFALDLLHSYFMEHHCGTIPTLRDVYKQIKMIEQICD